VLGQSISQVDSLKFGQMTETDTLHLLLPRAVVVHDTVEVAVHDTVYMVDRTPVEVVDLGLSVKWASCNIGATKPEEYGDYFAWGETSPKESYGWSTYKYCNGSLNTVTKYCEYSRNGTVDNRPALEKADDAASVNWGGNWRMPTWDEQRELVDNCTTTWTEDYKGTGVAGHIFTSKKTGYTDKSIFLPATGYSDETNVGAYSGWFGLYWASTLYRGDSNEAFTLEFNYHIVEANDSFYRYYGRAVRAVCP